MISLPIPFLLCIAIKVTLTYADNTWEYLDSTLPKGISDMTATYSDSDSKIYIFGGCDSGNTRADFDPKMFICTNVSDEGFIFDPSDNSFNSTKTMPRERYRHSAAIWQGKIYLVGGRDVMDNIITDVDVYDIASGTWTTPFQLDPVMAKSDFGMFSYGDSFHMAGGYDSGYTASNSTYKLDMNTLAVTELSNMVESRGDIYAERIGDIAVVAGGFTHEDYFCQAKNSTERYDISKDKWVKMNDMNINRGDQALVALEHYLFALGGEYKITCTGDAAESTTPADEVDVLDLSTATTSTPWTKLDDIPDNRFRFTGEAHPPTDTIFIFGGQKYYDVDCDCYDVSDRVLAYHVHHDTFPTKLGSTKSAAFEVTSLGFSVFGTTAAFAFLVALSLI